MKNIIIIPAYKPSLELIPFVEKLKEYFSDIVIVNDGSMGDEYTQTFDTLRMIQQCTILNHYTNLGKGRALKTAFNYCLMLAKEKRATGVITVDADGQHSLDSILKVQKKMENFPSSLILGCREFSGKVPLRSRFGNCITKYVFRWLCGLKITDTQTGLRGIPIMYLEFCCKIEGEKYEYETNMLLKAKEANISLKETVIETIYENNNQTSHFNPVTDSLKIYKSIILYSMSSLCAVLMDYATFTLFVNAGVNLFTCTYIGRFLSSFINFIMNRRVVFKAKDQALLRFIKYICLVIFSGTISAVLISLISCHISVHPLFIKMPIECILFFVNFYIQNNFIFNKKDDRLK